MTDSGSEPAVLVSGAVMMVAAGFGLFLWSSSLILLLCWNVLLGLGHLLGVIGQQSMVARGEPTKLDFAVQIRWFSDDPPPSLFAGDARNLMNATEDTLSVHPLHEVCLVVVGRLAIHIIPDSTLFMLH